MSDRKCDVCGYILDWSDTMCPKCTADRRLGHQMRAALLDQPDAAELVQEPTLVQAPAPAVSPAGPVAPDLTPNQPLPANLDCTVCGNSNTQKVSALHRGGTWTTKGHSSSVHYTAVNGHIVPAVGAEASTGAGSTELARLLEPPRRPDMKTGGGAMILLFLLGFLSLGFCLLGTVGVALSAVLIGGMAFLYHEQKDAQETLKACVAADIQIWEDAARAWERLFYCPRCDSVYFPETGPAAPVAQMQNLLYRH